MMATYVSLFREQCLFIQLVGGPLRAPLPSSLEKCVAQPARERGREFASRRDVGDLSDALDNRPGTRPRKRMVGNDVILVLPVTGLPRPHPDMHLVLRFDPDGEVFAATSRRTNDSS
jgi:hypothetical protein